VSIRRDELALRLALGASPAALNRDVLGRAAALAVTGSAIGIVLALWLLPVIRTMLYGVSPFDPATLGSAVVAMTAIALLSAALPAARARAVDPVRVLGSRF
jgi:ABC-type antimicrobial peptide transport system permease subunit